MRSQWQYRQLLERTKSFPLDLYRSVGGGQQTIKQARGARILVYHGVCKDHPLRYNTLFVTQKTFESQLILYKKYFNILTLDDYYQGLFDPDRFNICISFDDGFANNYAYVLPLLEQYEVPATFFVTAIRTTNCSILWNDFLAMAREHGPSLLDFQQEKYIRSKDGRYYSLQHNEPLDDLLRSLPFADKEKLISSTAPFYENAPREYWEQMTINQISQLSASKWVTIGSHSLYHDDLVELDINSAFDDMAQSRLFLEQITGQNIKAFAFPYGAYDRDTVMAALSAGYSQLLSTGFLSPGDGNEVRLKERLTINPFISSTNQVHAIIRGHYN